MESQSWPGNVGEVSRRLGRYQKDMFEGRCAAYPQARMYVANADSYHADYRSRGI
jgi:hypothetical protein